MKHVFLQFLTTPFQLMLEINVHLTSCIDANHIFLNDKNTDIVEWPQLFKSVEKQQYVFIKI